MAVENTKAPSAGSGKDSATKRRWTATRIITVAILLGFVGSGVYAWRLQGMIAGLQLRRATLCAYMSAEMTTEAGPGQTYREALDGFIEALTELLPRLEKRAYGGELVMLAPDYGLAEKWQSLLQELKNQAEKEPTDLEAYKSIQRAGEKLADLASKAAESALEAKHLIIPRDIEEAREVFPFISDKLAAFSQELALFENKAVINRSPFESKEVCVASREAGVWLVPYAPEFQQTEQGREEISRFQQELERASLCTRELADSLEADSNPDKRKVGRIVRLYAKSMLRRGQAIEAIAGSEYKGAYAYLMDTSRIAQEASFAEFDLDFGTEGAEPTAER